MSKRPLTLIEVLVAEYEQQAQMNGWADLPAPYTIESIHAKCDEIEKQARKNVPGGNQPAVSSAMGEGALNGSGEGNSQSELTPEQQDFVCVEADKLLKGFYKFLHKRAKQGEARSAICFSGGGIRSATFGLGLLQGLVASGLGLDKFHFLSTVSGGGYIGSWLSAWIHRSGVRSAQDGLLPLSDRVKKSDDSPDPNNAEEPILPNNPEATPIQHLRRYSNYMSPKLGLFSADTWTLVAIFFRNLLLNWTVLIPLLLAGLVLPRLAVSAASWHGADQHPSAEKIALLMAFVCAVVCIVYMVAGLPSLRSRSRLSERLKSETWFLLFCWLTLNIAAFLSAAYWAWNHTGLGRSGEPAWWLSFQSNLWQPMVAIMAKFVALLGLPPKSASFALFGLLIHIIGYLIARAALIRGDKGWLDDLVDFVTRALTGLAGGIFLWKATSLFQNADVGLYVTFAPPVFLLMFLLASTLFIGFASTYTTDSDREWLSRTGGWMLISVFGWSVLCALVIYGPVGLVYFAKSLASVGVASGALTLLGGFSSKTSATKKTQDAKKDVGVVGKILSASLPLAATVFAIIVLAALSLAISWLLTRLWPDLQTSFSQGIWWPSVVSSESKLGQIAWLVGPVLLIGFLMGLFININKFSLHSAYRDRLIRAYLGASNVTRRPNPFTGFDEHDNIQMHDLLTELFRPVNIVDPAGMAKKLKGDLSECRFVYYQLSPRAQKMVDDCVAGLPVRPAELKQALADDLNRVIQSGELWEKSGFAERSEQGEVKKLMDAQPSVPLFPYAWLPKRLNERKVYVQRVLINRKLIEETFDASVTSPEPFEKEARPLHIINTTLNLVGGKELAWQERKAQPFTVSPLHAGSYGLGYRNVCQYAVSRQQNGALSLGTSLAISGAAVSPNMGYNSSPAVTFLLTLFNVRLGWWLGNPGEAGRETYTKPSPFFAPKPLIAETLGMTDSQHPYVYLSDGAHFENLALYEMVRRRCHYIFLSDAGADLDFNFDDLGNALRKIRIDLGVPIELCGTPIQHRVGDDKLFAADGKNASKYCALARIKYTEVDGEEAEDGWLIYLKPTVYGVEPQDVQNYAKANPAFPHETTGDQMYSESQFESYRALGQYAVQQMTNGGQNLGNLESLLREVRQYLGQNAP